MKKTLSVFVALMLSLSALAGCGKTETGNDENNAPDTEDTSLKISDNMISIDGKDYALPIAVADLLNDGWEIADDKLEAEYEAGYTSEGGSTAVKKSDSDKFFIRSVYNDADGAKALKDCKISGIQVSFSVAGDLKLGLACDVNEKSTYDEILNAFGEPEGNENFKTGRKDDHSLAYDVQNESKISYNFSFEDGQPRSFVIELGE